MCRDSWAKPAMKYGPLKFGVLQNVIISWHLVIMKF